MLLAYDLRDGRLVKKIDAAPAMLNDLTLLADGSLFATDMGRHKVMRLAPDANALEIWAEELAFPNGIVASEDGRFVYVGDFSGVTRFDLRDQSRQKLASTTWLGGIDGLSMHGGSLIAIQNTVGNPRVLRIDPSNGEVALLESKHELFEIPTTGTVAGSDYYFIANPGLRSFDENHVIWPREKLQDPVMLRIALD
jgi:sugar lactone lactonase YvrE